MRLFISKVIQNIRAFTFLGFVKYTILRLRHKEILIVGSCHCCGACCRSLSLDDGKGWIRNKHDFQQIVAECPEYNCFKIIGQDNNGFLLFRCALLSDAGKCQNYENRFQFCRDFPDKSLPFCGGKLPAGCGYKFQFVVPFSKILNETISKANEKNTHT